MDALTALTLEKLLLIAPAAVIVCAVVYFGWLLHLRAIEKHEEREREKKQ